MSSSPSPSPTQEPQCPDALLPGVSVVLPCHNARKGVADAIRAAIRVAGQLSDDYEVIVLDDGSTDGTAAVVAQLTRIDPRVRLIMHSGHRGYGVAVRSGMKAARKPWVLLTEGNLRIDLRAADDFRCLARHSDLVVGWRIMRCDPVLERARAAAWNRFVTRIFGLTTHDPECPVKLVRRAVLERVELTATGAILGTELLIRCRAAGADVTEVPFRERARVPGDDTPAFGRARSLTEVAKLYRPLRGLGGGSAGSDLPKRRAAEGTARLRLREP